MDCFAALAMTLIQFRLLAAHCARVVHIVSPSVRGRRECRVPASTRGLVCNVHEKVRTRAYRYSRSSPAFPARWVYGLYRALWRRIPFASIAGGLKVLAKPGWVSQNLRRLDTSNGCQNHTALPSATASFVGARPSLTGHKPALRKPACAPGALRPPLPAPNVRDDRDTPLLWARDGGSCRGDLGLARSRIFLIPGLDAISENQK
jgi:hypothetical protein